MWKDRKIAVVVPAYNEHRLIARMLGRLPPFVDAAYVVDDASTDGTGDTARAAGDARVVVIRHQANRGVGAAIATGYREALRGGADVMVVMAGDDQMSPDDLPALLEPVLAGRADYAKGNRLIHREYRRMPLVRRAAGHLLGAATRAATGYYIGDSQCGFTALSAAAAMRLPLDELWPRYGYPNDLLGMLRQAGCSVEEVAVRPVYADEASGVRPWHALTVLGVVLRRWWLGGAVPSPPAATSTAPDR